MPWGARLLRCMRSAPRRHADHWISRWDGDAPGDHRAWAVLQSRGFPRGSLAPRGARGDHPRAWGSCALGLAVVPRFGRRARGCCARGWEPRRASVRSRIGERIEVNGVTVSLHPAGHILGSAQVRVEHRGEVWVVSGDYKTEPDPTCTPFEPVRCHTFITESTFGLPIYRWGPQAEVFEEMRGWWAREPGGGPSVDRVRLRAGEGAAGAGGAARARGRADLHPRRGGAPEPGLPRQRHRASRRPPMRAPWTAGPDWAGSLIVAPPSAAGSTWLRRFGSVSTAFASGWMRIRGHAPATRSGPRLRPLGPRGLAGAARRDRGDGRRAGVGDPWLPRAGRALAAGAAGSRRRPSPAGGRARRRVREPTTSPRSPTRWKPTPGNTGGRIQEPGSNPDEALRPAVHGAGRDHPHRREGRGDGGVLPRGAGRRTRRGRCTS